MKYSILYSAKAVRSLKKIPKNWRERILEAIEELSESPFLGKKLKGPLSAMYSLRLWPYRILYVIRKKEVQIEIVDVDHRQKIYG
ncbi:type II toxin-antitoxin system RelE/ParE family toxin [Candidatus Peregrinibacteria bacterium]|nr:type II toxin-antitoxin system RelE/ParE family toxin [Candidatus Peregrinibacteria bacterium]